MTTRYERALGSLLGSFVGDAIGAQTEFKTEKEVKRQFPDGIKEMDTANRYVGEAGEITDDSEMAIMLILSILKQKQYQQSDARRSYIQWRDSGPSDIGITIFGALDGAFNPQSQANGALMRITPIGILGNLLSTTTVVHLAEDDCAITHCNPVCRDCNRLFALAISLAIGKGWNTEEVYAYLLNAAPFIVKEKSVIEALGNARREEPKGIDGPYKGWVLIAFQLALHTVLTTSSFEEGMEKIIMKAGDADTNAAIYGALAGAFATKAGIPERWVQALKISPCMKRILGNTRSSLPNLASKWVEELLALPVASYPYL